MKQIVPLVSLGCEDSEPERLGVRIEPSTNAARQGCCSGVAASHQPAELVVGQARIVAGWGWRLKRRRYRHGAAADLLVRLLVGVLLAGRIDVERRLSRTWGQCEWWQGLREVAGSFWLQVAQPAATRPLTAAGRVRSLLLSDGLSRDERRVDLSIRRTNSTAAASCWPDAASDELSRQIRRSAEPVMPRRKYSLAATYRAC
jgi:hypothetical protein